MGGVGKRSNSTYFEKKKRKRKKVRKNTGLENIPRFRFEFLKLSLVKGGVKIDILFPMKIYYVKYKSLCSKNILCSTFSSYSDFSLNVNKCL